MTRGTGLTATQDAFLAIEVSFRASHRVLRSAQTEAARIQLLHRVGSDPLSLGAVFRLTPFMVCVVGTLESSYGSVQALSAGFERQDSPASIRFGVWK